MQPSLQELIDQLVRSGTLSPEMLAQVHRAMSDPRQLDELTRVLTEMGAADMGSGPPLNIADFYRGGTEPFELRWQLGAALPLPFGQLDHKTQFFVLFQEWTRREMEGMVALNGGRLAEAKRVFEECLLRARQIEVGELLARSYEGLGRVAEKEGLRTSARDYARMAAQARTV